MNSQQLVAALEAYVQDAATDASAGLHRPATLASGLVHQLIQLPQRPVQFLPAACGPQ
ncbi:hypothetical protein D3C72_2034350 [compost metagenome]